MAIPLPKASGYLQMMKEGSQYFSGVEEAVIRSIEAANEFTRVLKTSYGPKGLNKMIVNHIEKLFVTNDAATIIEQLDVEHPAAKIIIMASQQMDKEVGDGTNFVILFAGALLQKAEELIRMGLKPVEIANGFELAAEKVLEEILPKLVVGEIKDFQSKDEMVKGIKTCISSKQLGDEDFLSDLVARACISVMPSSGEAFNVDNVRVAKILGSGVRNSYLEKGMIFKRSVEGDVTKANDAKIVVYSCPVDFVSTETKGTVLIKSAEELRNFSRGEEVLFEENIKKIVDTGVKVIISGGKFSDMALHFCNKYNLLAIRVQSKWDLRRVCKTVNATALTTFTTPRAEDLGFCDEVFIDEVGGTPVVVIRQASNSTKISTVIIRGSSDNYMDDIERTIDDGVNCFKALTKDGRLVAGAGACEFEMAAQLASIAESEPGLEQYSFGKFAEALLSLPASIVENAGLKYEVVDKIFAAHQQNDQYAGVNIAVEGKQPINAKEAELYDLYLAKLWGIKYATNAAITILLVDQIICAKKAGGPKPRKGGGDWDADD